MKNLTRHLSTVVQIARLPVADLHFYSRLNPGPIDETYRYFTKPHPKYRVIRNKSVGAALIDMQRTGEPDKYLHGIAGKNQGASLARRARSRGYTLAAIDRNHFVDDIHAINTSVECRQGRPMDQHYLEKAARFEAEKHFKYFGILNKNGKLVAYANLGCYGNFCAFSQILGLRNNDGIMHMLVVDIVCRLLAERAFSFVMYDTFFGASPGMKQFKTILGFTPYRVKYRLE